MKVSAPASTANLGSGFDSLALALDERFQFAVTRGADPAPVGFERASDRHPAMTAYRTAGGEGTGWFSTTIAPGKGMGYSGAAAVAGAAAAIVDEDSLTDTPAGPPARDLETIQEIAATQEGHLDNAAASTYGGFTVAGAGHVTRLDPPAGLTVVQWIPDDQTSTSASRGRLPESVPLAVAVESIGRTALMVAGLVSGDLGAISLGAEDHLHQPTRLAGLPTTAAAIQTARDAGAVAAWLSGSGPSVCALVDPSHRDAVAGALEAMPLVAPTRAAHLKPLSIASDGVLVSR